MKYPIVFTVHVDLEMPEDWGQNGLDPDQDLAEHYCLGNIMDQLVATVEADGEHCNVCNYASARLAEPGEERGFAQPTVHLPVPDNRTDGEVSSVCLELALAVYGSDREIRVQCSGQLWWGYVGEVIDECWFNDLVVSAPTKRKALLMLEAALKCLT